MGVITFTDEVTSPVAPARLFKALIIENDHLLPKLLPQEIKSIEIVHGNGGVGSIKQTNFAEGGPFKCMKHRLDAIDEANFECKYSLIEGDMLGDKIEKVSHELKLEVAPGGGSVAKMTVHFHGTGDIKEEDIKDGQEKAKATFRVLEAYLIANPAACA